MYHPGLNLILTGDPGDLVATTRFVETGRYLETEPEILFSRYGLASQEWTIVGSIGAYAKRIRELGEMSFVGGDDESGRFVDRARFADMMTDFLGVLANAGMVDLPQYPGFSVVPLAAYRVIAPVFSRSTG